MEETTNSDSAGWKTRTKTLDDVSGSVTGLELIGFDYDPGAGTTKLNAIKRAGTPLFLEHTLAGERFRAWVLLESEEVSGTPEQVARMTHAWQGTARVGANRTEDAVPTWEFP